MRPRYQYQTSLSSDSRKVTAWSKAFDQKRQRWDSLGYKVFRHGNKGFGSSAKDVRLPFRHPFLPHSLENSAEELANYTTMTQPEMGLSIEPLGWFFLHD